MADMGNSPSDESIKSDTSTINAPVNDVEAQLSDPSQTPVEAEAYKETGEGKCDIKTIADTRIGQGDIILPKDLDINVSETKDVQGVPGKENAATPNEEGLKPATEENKIVPATPPGTPTNSGDQPKFHSPNLDTTFVLCPGDDVSNPSVKTTDTLSPSTPEIITAPILEAAAIANAVAGICISNPSTPLTLSTPTGGEPLFNAVVEVSQESKSKEDIQAAAPTELNENCPKNARDEEVEFLRARVKALETELVAALSKPGSKNHVLVETIKQQHEELLSKARGMLFDKTKIVKNQELQIEALNAQVASLKDVNSITKDLLEIRNSEIKHLEDRLNNMDARFKAEKERHTLVLKRAETGQNINNDLKTEYEGQLKIFKDLREMYDQRVQALVKENQSLKECLAAAKAQPSQST